MATAALVATFAGLYGATLQTGPDVFGDRTKFMFLGKILGIPHPTGFPLYLILNHLVAAVPVGVLAVRENGLSAALSIGALCCVYLTVRRLAAGPATALAAAMLLGLTPTFWRQAIVAEVYGLHALIVAGTWLALVVWHGRPERRAPLYAALLLLALSAANHPTCIAMVPPVGYLVLATDRKVIRDAKVVGAAAAFLVLSLAMYGYLFWRTSAAGPHLEFRITDVKSLVDYMSGSRFRAHSFLAFSPQQVVLARLPAVGKLILGDVSIGVILSAIGAVVLRPRAIRNALVGAALVLWLLVANYDNFPFRLSEYLIPACIAIAVLAAAGATRLGAWSRRRDAVAAGVLGLCVLITGISGLGAVRKARAAASVFDTTLRSAFGGLGERYVLMMDGYGEDYGVFEGFSYYIWGEGLGGRDVFVSTLQPPGVVADYLVGGTSFFDRLNARTVPAGLRVLTTSRSYCSSLRRFGIGSVQVGDRLFELRAHK